MLNTKDLFAAMVLTAVVVIVPLAAWAADVASAPSKLRDKEAPAVPATVNNARVDALSADGW